jgi:hypothetical protein
MNLFWRTDCFEPKNIIFSEFFWKKFFEENFKLFKFAISLSIPSFSRNAVLSEKNDTELLTIHQLQLNEFLFDFYQYTPPG